MADWSIDFWNNNVVGADVTTSVPNLLVPGGTIETTTHSGGNIFVSTTTIAGGSMTTGWKLNAPGGLLSLPGLTPFSLPGSLLSVHYEAGTVELMTTLPLYTSNDETQQVRFSEFFNENGIGVSGALGSQQGQFEKMFKVTRQMSWRTMGYMVAEVGLVAAAAILILDDGTIIGGLDDVLLPGIGLTMEKFGEFIAQGFKYSGALKAAYSN